MKMKEKKKHSNEVNAERGKSKTERENSTTQEELNEKQKK